MAKRFYFKESDNIEIGVDGAFYTDYMTAEFESAIVVIAGYDANGDIVAPTAGTATVTVFPIDGQGFTGASDGDNPIDLTLIGENATYNIPLFLGPIERASITLSGVTGAVDHFIAYMWRK